MLRPVNLLGYLFTFMLILILASPVNAQFSGGDGTPENPYQIDNVFQLNQVRLHLDAHFIQTESISFLGTSFLQSPGFAPIGDISTPFTGSYDGQGFAIRFLPVVREDSDNVGLFGVLQNNNLDLKYSK